MELLYDLSIYTILLLMVVAFSAGFIDSIAGGGGLIMLPAFLLAGIPAQFALGTNKFVAITGTSTALFNFIKSGKVIWKIAIIGLISSFIGSIFGTKAILYLDEEVATKIIMWILPLTAIITFIPKKQIKSVVSDFSNIDLYVTSPIICFVIGFYDGFLGPGAGTFFIISFYAILGMNMVNASAVAKVFNLASGVGAFITFAFAGKVLYFLAIPLIISNILGSYIGSKIAINKGHSFIRVVIIIVFILMFISLVVKFI